MKHSNSIWHKVAAFIIRKRILVIAILIVITGLLASQWKYNKFAFSEANLLPKDHPINLQYELFKKEFGVDGNMMVIGVKDSSLFTPEKFNAWNELNKRIKEMEVFTSIISTQNLSVLKKDTINKKFIVKKLISDSVTTFSQNTIDELKDKLANKLPFYKNLIMSSKSHTICSMLFMDKEVVNTNVRKETILSEFIPMIKEFERKTSVKVHISGMPYIRTVNTQIILNEVILFMAASLLITSFVFFLFFRSIRATAISMLVVCVAVSWGFGLLGLFEYKINVITSLIPPLIIVIGIPNCIFLINKYQQGIKNHGNKVRSLINVIVKVGNATLMTNLTTATGFGTFIIANSVLLKEFGTIVFLNIIGIFILTITIIPIVYSYMPIPKAKHLKHLNKNWSKGLLSWIERCFKHHRTKVYLFTIIISILGILGISKIQVSGSLLDDIPQERDFSKDILFFEREFNGILPLEIIIDTKQKKGATKLSNLKKADRLQEIIRKIPELSEPISIVNAMKYAKQTFYNGNPEYYSLPTSQENSFILSYIKKPKEQNLNFLDDFVDENQQIIRITTSMKDLTIKEMDRVEKELLEPIEKIFSKERYDVLITGNPIVFTKGTPYLIRNLFTSLLLAIIFISLLIIFLFKSFRITVISLVTNLVPLVFIGGMMGFMGIPLKPSTILIFSIAFGISVDDTLHFLARYKQVIKHHKDKKAISIAFTETSLSMLYTSIILLLGFSVFTLSSFGGTVALGFLVSMTLFYAMLSNLILLPCLLISYKKNKLKKMRKEK